MLEKRPPPGRMGREDPAGAPPYATLLSFSRYVDRAGSAKATFVGSSRPARQSRSGFNPHNQLLKALKEDIQHGRRGEQLAIAAGMRCPAPVAAALRGPAEGGERYQKWLGCPRRSS
jgi:hypothetical protein